MKAILRNSYFRPKIIAFSKKKVAAACNRQDLCKIVPQAACGIEYQ